MERPWHGRRIALAGAAAVGLAVLLPAAAEAATSVSIVNFAYSPTSVTVPAGTTVSWHNADSAPHSVTADGGAFDSSPSSCSPTESTGCVQPGGGYSFTFASAGTFSYHCKVHSFMHGTVVVTAVTTTTAATTTTTVGGTTTTTSGATVAGLTTTPTSSAGSAAGTLAVTGAHLPGWLAPAAAALVALGSAIVLAARRRQPAPDYSAIGTTREGHS